MTATRNQNTESLFICTNVFIAVRSNPSHRSEMVNQVLFGERFRIVESSGSWIKIETELDSYQGWIDGTHNGFKTFTETGEGIITGHTVACFKEDGSPFLLAPGSELFNMPGSLDSFSVGGNPFHLDKNEGEKLLPDNSIVETGLKFLNSPYLWGGRTPWGIDCSGLVQVVYKIHGAALPRDASKQAENGQMIEFIEQALPGDLLFFSGEGEGISHTGILVSPGNILHSSGTVKISTVDHQGIWDADAGRYTHRLRFIRRIEI